MPKNIYCLFIFAALALSGCAANTIQPALLYSDARVTDTTTAGQILANLPTPKEPVVISVYDFSDQTGQFRQNDKVTDYSSAVTKGGLAVLTKALLDTGNGRWFKVIERGSLNNLLQERQIVDVTRQQYTTADGQKLSALPPLMYSGVVLEGGIIFYDSNTFTGGAGARYFGIGGSTEYRRDMVGIYLRLVSVQTGEVLLSVNSSKTLFSTTASLSAIRFLSFDKLFEAETGFSYNEPSQLAVRQAIETAVYSLVMEGAKKGLWSFADPAAGQVAFGAYTKRRDSVQPPPPQDDASETGPARNLPLNTASPVPSLRQRYGI